MYFFSDTLPFFSVSFLLFLCSFFIWKPNCIYVTSFDSLTALGLTVPLIYFFIFFCLSVWKVSIDLSSGLWILFWFVWNLLAIPWKAFFISVTLLSMSSVSFHCSLECVPLLILPIFDAYYLLATFVSESHSGDSLVSSEYLCVSMHVCCVMCVCLTFGLPCNFLLEARHVASGKTKWGK